MRVTEADELFSVTRLSHEGQARRKQKSEKRSQGKMAAYARIYGIRIYSYNQIRGNTENYIRLSADCYILEADYDYLEELLDKEN